MPSKAKRPCRFAGCTELVIVGAYCDQHKGERGRVTDEHRPSAAKRGYDANWGRLRLHKLALNPLCEECLTHDRVTVANEVDHILPLAQGGTNELTNLRSLCKPCHSRKTARQSRRGVGGANL